MGDLVLASAFASGVSNFISRIPSIKVGGVSTNADSITIRSGARVDDIHFDQSRDYRDQSTHTTHNTTYTGGGTHVIISGHRKMAYGRKYKRTYRKRKFVKRKKYRMYKKGYKKFNRTGGYLRMQSGSTRKFNDRSILSSTQITTSAALPGYAELVNVITQGTTETDRIGNKVLVSQVYVKGTVQLPPVTTNAGSQSDIVDVYLIQDTQCNSTDLSTGTGTGTLGSVVFNGDGGTPNYTTQCMRRLDTSQRMKILDHQRITLNTTSGWNGTNLNSQNLYAGFDLSWKGSMIQEYILGNTGGSPASLRTNVLYVLFMGTTAKAYVSNFYARTRFTD